MEDLGMGGRRDPADQKEHERYLSAVRQQLDEARFAAACALGRAMNLEQATAFALEETGT